MSESLTYRVTFITIDGDTAETSGAAKSPEHAAYDAHKSFGDIAVESAHGIATYVVTAPDGTTSDVEVNADGLAMSVWLRLIDRHMVRLIGLTHSDLADWHYWDNWAACTKPRDAAIEVIENDEAFAGLVAGIYE